MNKKIKLKLEIKMFYNYITGNDYQREKLKMNHRTGEKHIPRLPGWTLSVCCGRGSIAEVWQGEDPCGHRQAVRLVSRKQDPAVLAKERAGVGLFWKLCGRNPHLLNIYQTGETADHLYSIMECADSLYGPDHSFVPDTLAARLERAPLPVDEVLTYLDSILSGVEFLHDRNLAHGDLQPANILFVRGVLKIGDPGLVLKGDREISGGTAQFRPPWIASGIEADIYAVGILIYVMLTGQRPSLFPELPDQCSLSAIMPLNMISLRCCERNPKLRFRRVAEIRNALTGVKKTLTAGGSFISCRIEDQAQFEQQPGRYCEQQLTEYIRR